jgi:hypothetical protein
MQNRTDLEQFVKEVRQSEMYPALVGGIAGGLAGALMAVIVAALFSRGRAAPAEPSEPKAIRAAGPSWSLRDIVDLIAVGMSLARQVQDWRKGQIKK